MMPMRRMEQISPEAVSVLKFPLKMSKAGEILEKIMMKVAFWFRIGNWSWRMMIMFLSPVQGWLVGELLQLQWNWELWSTMVMPATLYWRDQVGERTPGNWRRKNWRRKIGGGKLEEEKLEEKRKDGAPGDLPGCGLVGG